MMRESDLIEIDDKKFLRVLYVSKLPKSLTPRFYNRITTMEDINIITTLNINPTNSAKMIKVVDKSLSAMETERLEKIKRAGKSNLYYEYVKDKKLETKISNAEQLQYDLQKNNQLVIEALAFIRGRSLSETFCIIDEAQNLTPHEIKTIITRAGEGTKMVFTGDIQQIDSPYLDAQSNGLAYMIDKMKGQELFAHINLIKGERSQLSEMASNLL